MARKFQPAFERNPPLKSYQYMAYALGAILPFKESGEFALLNNYIQLESSGPVNKSPAIRFAPFIGPTTFLERGLGPQYSLSPRNKDDFIEALNNTLLNGFLARLLVDEYYIPERSATGLRHNFHDVLVIDVSLNMESCTIIGYCDDRRYRASLCGTDILYRAFYPQKYLGPETFVAYAFAPTKPLSLNKQLIIESLKAYVESTPTNKTHVRGDPYEPVYGLSIFKIVTEYLRQLEPSKTFLDRRLFSILADHARMMKSRSDYFRVGGKGAEDEIFHAAVLVADRLKLLSLLPRPVNSLRYVELMISLCNELRRLSEASAVQLISRLR